MRPPPPPPIHPAWSPPVGPRTPRCPRWARSIASLAAAMLLAAAGGCGGEDDLIGTGPVRSVAPTPDGQAIVLRAWRHRTPGAAVLLHLDPVSGRAAPILPKLEGRRGATIRAIEVAVPRPETVPSELLIAAPEIGLGIIRGPFVYLGERPVIEPLWPDRMLPPDGGPDAALSPDGGRLLLFARNDADDDPAAAWTAAVIDLRSLERTDLSPPRGDRRGRWLDDGRLALGEDPPRAAGDGFAAPSSPLADATGDEPGPWRVVGDPPRLEHAGPAGPVTIPLPGPPSGVRAWPSAAGGSAAPAAPAAIAWTDATLLRIALGPDGGWTAEPLAPTFDRTR